MWEERKRDRYRLIRAQYPILLRWSHLILQCDHCTDTRDLGFQTQVICHHNTARQAREKLVPFERLEYVAGSRQSPDLMETIRM